jgi:hypothetical protein
MRVRRKDYKFQKTAGEEGSLSIIFVVLLSAASLVGVSALVKKYADEGKVAKLNERRADAALNPINAAIVAKSLFSPPGLWTTPNLVGQPARMPSLYVDPYIPSAAVFAGTPPAGLTLVNPSPAGSAIWSSAAYASSRSIDVFAVDRNRLNPAGLNSLLTDAADGGSFDASLLSRMPTTKSTIKNFVLSHCTPTGAPSASYTGVYCVQADFITANYSVNSNAASGSNSSTVFLGTLPVPPPPVCNSVVVPPNIQPGDTRTVTVSASGVVTGYTFSVSAMVGGAMRNYVNQDVSRVLTPANSVRGIANLAPMNIDLTNLNSFNYTTMPNGTRLSVNVSLKGVTGATVACPAATIVVTRPSCSLAFNKTTPYMPGENVFMSYGLANSRPGDVSNYQQQNIAMNGRPPASPDGNWQYSGTAPGGNNVPISASVTLRRGPLVVAQCSTSGVSTIPCRPNPNFARGTHYGNQANWDPSRFLSIPGRLPFELYNQIAGNPGNSSLVDSAGNRTELCQRVFGPYAAPWGGGALRYSSPGNNTVCFGVNGRDCRNAKAAGNPPHITWTLCRCDIRFP